jgi:hypothetical protein
LRIQEYGGTRCCGLEYGGYVIASRKPFVRKHLGNGRGREFVVSCLLSTT